jgi:hypothetical protein
MLSPQTRLIGGKPRAVKTALLLIAISTGCAADPCDPNKQSCTYDKTVSTFTVAAGHEDEDTCQSWTLENPTELWVSSITQHNDGAYHHANWFIVPDTTFVLPDGAWSCASQDFMEVQAALLGGYLFAQSTQSRDETQTLPNGAAIRIPPHSRLIGASHLLNTGDADVKTSLHLTLRTIPPAQVQAKLAPGRIQYHDLHIDPSAQSSFTTECDIAAQYPSSIGAFHYNLYFTLAHYHGLGMFSELQVLGGPHDGQVIMHHDGGGNFGTAIDPPIDLVALGARGLRFTCAYNNPRPTGVGWGIGDQEMCVVALQAETDIGWDGEVNDGTGAKQGVAADGTVQYTGPCSVTAYPWDFNK